MDKPCGLKCHVYSGLKVARLIVLIISELPEGVGSMQYQRLILRDK